MSAKQCTIYVLIDPRDGKIRYVGQTVSKLGSRLSSHIYQARTVNRTHLHRWLNLLAREGTKPLIRSVQTGATFNEDEQFWIRFYKDQGFDLINATEGGGGTLGHRWPENRKRRHAEAMRQKMKGRVFSDETRERMSRAKRGRVPACSRHGRRRRFSDSQAAKIRAEYGAGASLSQLAKKHDCHLMTISRVVNGVGYAL